MGITHSIDDIYNDSELKYKEIKVLTDYLYKSYDDEFVSSNFCEKMVDIYYKKQHQDKKRILDDLAINDTMFNDKLIVIEKENSDTLCKKIQDDYTTRLGKIKNIYIVITKIKHRILALMTGPKCVENPEIFDETECVNTGSIWKTEIYLPSKQIKYNDKWYAHFNLLLNIYLKGMKFIIGYLKILLETNITLEIINSTIEMIHTELVMIDDKSKKSYLELLKIQTYTSNDVLRMKQEQQAIYEALRKDA